MGVSLARLLVDMSRADLNCLAQAWNVPDAEHRGLAAAVYRRMTDPAVAKSILDRLSPPERSVLQRMARIDDPVTAGDLLRTLPLSEDTLVQILSHLERLGIAWRVGVTPRRSNADTGRERLWVIPVDLARSFQVDGHSLPRKVDVGTLVSEPPPLLALTGIVAQPAVGIGLAQSITSLGDGGVTSRRDSPSSPSAHSWSVMPCSLVEWVGIALGVVVRERRQIVPGPRWTNWMHIGPRERTQAVLRLWLVEDRMPGTPPPQVRHALLRVLRDAEPRQWYDVDSVARRAAWSIGQASTHFTPAGESGVGRRGSLVSRRDVDHAIRMLSWMDVVLVALTPNGQARGLQLTEAGDVALR